MALKDTSKQLRNFLENILGDLEKADAGNKAAAQRVRTDSIKFAKIAKMYRKESIQAEKSGVGSKKKASKAAAPKKASGAKKPVAKKAAAKKAPAKKAAVKSAAKKASAKKASAKALTRKRPTAKLPKKK